METTGRVGRDEFIRSWETSANVQEAAEKCGLAKTSAQARAAKYRSLGLPLKRMPRGGGAEAMNKDSAYELLAEIRGLSVEDVRTEGEAFVATADSRKRKSPHDQME